MKKELLKQAWKDVFGVDEVADDEESFWKAFADAVQKNEGLYLMDLNDYNWVFRRS